MQKIVWDVCTDKGNLMGFSIHIIASIDSSRSNGPMNFFHPHLMHKVMGCCVQVGDKTWEGTKEPRD